MKTFLLECLEYCKDQIQTSGGMILEGISIQDINTIINTLELDEDR